MSSPGKRDGSFSPANLCSRLLVKILRADRKMEEAPHRRSPRAVRVSHFHRLPKRGYAFTIEPESYPADFRGSLAGCLRHAWWWVPGPEGDQEVDAGVIWRRRCDDAGTVSIRAGATQPRVGYARPEAIRNSNLGYPWWNVNAIGRRLASGTIEVDRINTYPRTVLRHT